MKKIALILVLLLGIAGRVSVLAPTARATTYYISWSSGSDSNSGTSQGSPWKTHPYMRCSAVSGYVHHAGDVFIFKGGDSWPSSCFEMDIAQGGVSGTADYYGVCVSNADFASETNHPGGGVNDSPCAGGTSWPSSSWTRPKFAADSATLGSGSNNVIRSNCASYSDAIAPTSGCNYVTIDNIEIGPWNYSGTFSTSQNADGPAITFGGALSTYAAAGVTVENMYIHDWFTTAHLTSANVDAPAYGGVYGVSLLRSSVISDAAGTFYIGSTRYTLPLMGGCAGCTEASGNLIHDGVIGCSSVGSCHDNEFYNISGESTVVFGTLGYHPHVIYEDSGCQQSAFRAYNNYVHDSDPGLLLNMYYQSQIFNNVFSNSSKAALYLESAPPGASCFIDNSAAVGYVANNTMDLSNGYTPGNNGACFQWFGSTGLGTLYQENNICIPNTAGLGAFSVTHLTTGGPGGGLYNMSTSEASSHGYTQANKYAPSSSDSNTAATGANLTSFCTGTLTPLCTDTRGAPWFGSTGQARPTGSTGWAAGAFQGAGSGGGGAGPPSISISAPSPGTVSGTITLTASCTPGTGTTVSSIQFTIDGSSFGAAGTSSPYSLGWDTTTAANAQHVIGAKCTQSDSQTANASTVTVTVSNSMPGCFISTDNDSGALSWTANTYFGSQAGTFTLNYTAKPNTANQDTVVGISNAPITAYGQAAALVRFNSSGMIDVYKGSLGNYTADVSESYAAGTTYAFTVNVNLLSGNYTVALTSPVAATIATGYTFRSGANASSLGYVNAVGDDDTPDTVKVCGVQVGSVSLTPAGQNFGSVNVGSSSSPVTFTLANTTSSAVTSIAPTTTGGNASDFTVANSGSGSCGSLGGSLAAGNSCTFTVAFSPSAAGARSTSLHVSYGGGDGASPRSSALSGTGTNATAPTPPTNLKATVE